MPTQDLDQFNLDLRDWFGVSRVAVGKHRAAYFQEDGQELVITPRPKLHAGRTYTVDVDYRGVPETVVDPDDSFEGWVKNQDGAFVVNEPQGSPGWFPVNDDPNDKATVRHGDHGARGQGRDRQRRAAVLRHRRREDDLALARGLADGELPDDRHQRRLRRSRSTPARTGCRSTTRSTRRATPPPRTASAPPKKATAALRFAAQPQIIQVLTDLWGPYPFSSAGAVIDRGGVGYALESQSKPMYDGVPGQSTVVHELAHQWFGDSVTLSVWRDIWLNEGFARFSEWMYNERTGGQTAQQQFEVGRQLRAARRRARTGRARRR